MYKKLILQNYHLVTTLLIKKITNKNLLPWNKILFFISKPSILIFNTIKFEIKNQLAYSI